MCRPRSRFHHRVPSASILPQLPLLLRGSTIAGVAGKPHCRGRQRTLRLSPASRAPLLLLFPFFVSRVMLEHRALSRTRSLFRRPCASAGAAKKGDEPRRRSLLRSSLPGTGGGKTPGLFRRLLFFHKRAPMIAHAARNTDQRDVLLPYPPPPSAWRLYFDRK